MLPALNDDGAPCYDKRNAEYLAGLGVPTFACTPDKFPDLMAAALSKQDIGMWASKNIKDILNERNQTTVDSKRRNLP